MITLRARFDGRVLIPEGEIHLPAGTLVELQLVEPEGMAPEAGNIAALRQAIHEPPHLTNEDIDEFEYAIKEGKLPLRQPGPFDEGK